IVAYAGTGHVPFEAESMPAMAVRIMHDPPDLSDLAQPLRGLVERALSKNPVDRPTAQELLAHLTGSGPPTLQMPRANVAVPVSPATPVSREIPVSPARLSTATLISPPPPQVVQLLLPPQPPRHRGALVVSVTTMVLLIALLVGYFSGGFAALSDVIE